MMNFLKTGTDTKTVDAEAVRVMAMAAKGNASFSWANAAFGLLFGFGATLPNHCFLACMPVTNKRPTNFTRMAVFLNHCWARVKPLG